MYRQPKARPAITDARDVLRTLTLIIFILQHVETPVPMTHRVARIPNNELHILMSMLCLDIADSVVIQT